MKSIKDLKEQYESIVESESKEERKLTTLVRSGLFDAKKLPALKRAMDKPTEKMTPAEKKILIDLLDSLINQVVSSDQVYGKVKRNVQDMHEELKIDEPVTIKQVPSIVVFKRRAVRVYPGGRQVGLYYSYQLDKYITIPFGDAGLAMEAYTPQKKKKKIPSAEDIANRRDKIDTAIEKKDFATLSPAEKNRVSTGKVLVRALRKKQKPSVVAAKTMTAFMLNKMHEEQQLDEVLPVIARVATGIAAKVAGRTARSGTKGLSKGTRGSRALVKARRLARNAGGALAAIGDSDSDKKNNDNSTQEKPDRTIKHDRQSSLKVNVGGPEYKNASTSVDRQRDILNRKATAATLKESIELDGNQFDINKNMAEKIVGVYNSLNEENKKIMIKMLNDRNNQQKIFEFVTRY
jgi:hypothetical protein